MPGIEAVASSKARMRIAGLISTRPRTLGELADMSGISVQGVLKHIAKLKKHGFVAEAEVREGKHLRYRKLYSTKGRRIDDSSSGDLMVVRLSRMPFVEDLKVGNTYPELETIAEDVIIARRRIRDTTRRLERLIQEASLTQERLLRVIKTLGFDKEEEQIANIFFTEDSMEAAKNVLSGYYGSRDPETAIRSVLKKIRSRQG